MQMVVGVCAKARALRVRWVWLFSKIKENTTLRLCYEQLKLIPFWFRSFQRLCLGGGGVLVGQAGFRKGRGTRDQIANIRWIIEKAREFQKNIYFCFIDYAKAFDCVDHNKLWKILKEMEYQTTWPASRETCVQVRKQQLELDMEQQTGSK